MDDLGESQESSMETDRVRRKALTSSLKKKINLERNFAFVYFLSEDHIDYFLL